jgi:N-acetylmuramoyl-L-alanine amidase
MKRFACALLVCALLMGMACRSTPSPEEPPITPSSAVSPVPLPDPTAAHISVTAPPTEIPAKQSPLPVVLTGITIGIDPGHQAVADRAQEALAPNAEETRNRASVGTAGVVSGVREYTVVLNVALHLKQMLEASGATVILTRTSADVQLSEQERAQMLQTAQLSLSLHCEGANDRQQRGAFALVRTDDTQSAAAAESILAQYLANCAIPACAPTVSFLAENTFLNWSGAPALCFVLGHLSHPEEDALLSDAAYQHTLARALYQGIIAYFTETGRA